MRIKIFTAAALLTLLLSSCGSTEKIPYLVKAERLQLYELEQYAKIYEAKIMAKDILTISVNTTVPEAGAPFNLGSNAGSMVLEAGYANVAGSALQTYIVDKDGFINYPIVGKLKVMGLTRVEAQDLIKSSIHPAYITEVPVVNVRFKNYKVSVLGEVNRPGQFVVENEQCTILDALAMAGDMTIYGKRENVMLIREDNNGRKSITRINLQNPRLMLEPDVYYLQQNDVLYVEPNKTKSKAAFIGTGETYAISIISTLLSITTLLVTIFR
ncbi:MAG: sugar transporter [Bacteroidetes bacterium HGW-Bacteroidetes-5]|jgi:polysaccharide export outer membrane protein|nr:MAG: sugar transporter [Bacteroidetes bacterium HGW-Bacteroidetes-5]